MKRNSPLLRTVLLLTFFSIAMGFLEAAVVIYLRELYYPKGFNFPLAPISPTIALVEFLREAATVIMLLCIGIIAGKNKAERFSFFIFCFAVWDIIYYVVLKLFLNWPESFLTPDILFLIPIPWVGPVITPCIISVTMIVLTMIVVHYHQRNIIITINKREWFLLIFGALVLVVSFCWDYAGYVLRNNHSLWLPSSKEKLFDEVKNYIPQSFNWWLFSVGEMIVVAALIHIVRRHKKL